jgi:erythrocyte band 7 integral membrane protein
MSQVSSMPEQDAERGWVDGPGKKDARSKEFRSNQQIIHEEMLEEDEGGCCLRCCLVFSTTILIVLFFPLVVAKCIAVVQEYERAIIFRFGRVKKARVVRPGIYLVNPCLETVVKVDLRTRSFDVPPQEILTRDSVTVTVDAVVYYNIHDPLASVINVANADKSTKQIAATTLRSILGTKTLQETLAERDRIGEAIYAQVKEATDAWGVQVERVEVKDVRLPKQMQRAMAAEAEATREARAKVVGAEGEQKAARALKDASDIMGDGSGAMQLRYLQTLTHISAEKNSTIVFPLPMELLASMMGGRKEECACAKEKKEVQAVKENIV